MKLRVFSLSLLLLISVAPVQAEEDCNEKCCRFGVCEPVCKSTCEVNKKAAQTLKVPQPPGPPGFGDIEKALTQSCASGFELINKFVIISQGSYAAGSERLLNQAKDLLINAGVIPEQEFSGITIRWAKLNALGQAPDSGVILISEQFINNYQNLSTVAAVLAHEMMHQRQYARVGTDKFKCAYSREYIRVKGNQGNDHTWEREAYAFQDRANAMITQYFQQGGGGRPRAQTICQTQYIKCPPQPNAPKGSMCQCQAPAGNWVSGQVQ